MCPPGAPAGCQTAAKLGGGQAAAEARVVVRHQAGQRRVLHPLRPAPEQQRGAHMRGSRLRQVWVDFNEVFLVLPEDRGVPHLPPLIGHPRRRQPLGMPPLLPLGAGGPSGATAAAACRERKWAEERARSIGRAVRGGLCRSAAAAVAAVRACNHGGPCKHTHCISACIGSQSAHLERAGARCERRQWAEARLGRAGPTCWPSPPLFVPPHAWWCGWRATAGCLVPHACSSRR